MDALVKTLSIRLLLALVSMTMLAAPARAESRDEEFLNGLRQRRLYRLAAIYCRDEMARPGVTAARRGELALELSRTLAAQAVETPPAESGPLWQQALDVCDQHTATFPAGDPRGLLCRVQHALVLLGRGELLRRQSELVTDNGVLLDESRAQLRAAVAKLGPLTAEVLELQRPGVAAKLPTGSPTTAELFALEVNLNYQWARALRNQGHSYPPKSGERVDVLQQALERLKTLAQRPVTEPLGWTSRLDEISCYRLLGNFARAREQLDALAKLEPPPDVALEARAERIHLALDAGQLTEALAILRQGRAIGGQVSPELDYACLQALLASWKEAAGRQDPQAASIQERASELVRLIGQVHGAYWYRRAQTLEASYVVGGSTASSDVDALVRAAENFYRNSQFADATRTYDTARKQALAKNQAQRAFDLGFTAAAIVYQQKQLADAGQRFHELARQRENPKARQAHLAAVGVALEQATAAVPKPPAGTIPAEPELTEYTRLLEEHVKQWPEGPSSAEAHWRLGEVRERQRKWVDAINHYALVPPDHERYPLSIGSMARTFEAWLLELRSQGQHKQAADEGLKAAEWFEQSVRGGRNEWPEKWSQPQREAALAAARLWMAAERYDRAELVLTAALSDSAAPDAWLATARQLQVVALAGGQKAEAALAVLEQLAGGDAGSLLRMLQGIAPIAEKASPKVRGQLALIELRAAALLEPRRNQLPPASKRMLDQTQARALLAVGRKPEARAKYEALAKAYPDEGEVQEEYARVLVESADAEAIKQGYDQARSVERRSKPGTERWFRARYLQALALVQQGKKPEAKQLILVTRTLHPLLGGDELKARFEALER